MRVLGLDLSSKTGWGLLEDGKLVDYGLSTLDRSIVSFGAYPQSYWSAAEAQAMRVYELVIRLKPDVLVIEETNQGRNRYTQKFLEFLHCHVLGKTLREWKIVYVSSGTWRQALGLVLSKEDKRNNAKLSKAKKEAKKAGQALDKKKLGIQGRVNKKHIALRYVNATFGTNLKVKDNDIADAICLAAAYNAGARPCDGF